MASCDHEEWSEDEDVIPEHSPLHDLWVREGLIDPPAKENKTQANHSRPETREPSLQGPCDVSAAQLEVSVAQKVTSSDLLIYEDEYFVTNFILTEESLNEVERFQKLSSSPSMLGNVLFYFCSMVTAAASVAYMSGENRMVTTMAATMPSTLAVIAMSKWGVKEDSADLKQQEEVFHNLVDELLLAMKLFKQLVKKSLNLIQGMELMQSGFTLSVDSKTGGALSMAKSQSDTILAEKECLSVLRNTTYQAVVSFIKIYKSGIRSLMKISPLAEHVDFKEHYIAFLNLETFGIVENLDGKTVSVRELQDVIQIGLVQQSEYLRRFCLSFSDKVRERFCLDKSGILRHVRRLVRNLQKINLKLKKVFEYYQTMGVVSEEKHNSLLQKRKENLNFFPLRNVYTSLFTTGLHLQRSLIQVRRMEKTFDAIDKMKAQDTGVLNTLLPPENHLSEWFDGFKLIQTELNDCVACLNEGMAQIDVLQVRENQEIKKEEECKTEEEKKEDEIASHEKRNVVIDANAEQKYFDEVFEAFLEGKNNTKEDSDWGDLSDEERKRIKLQRIQSEQVLHELRNVLVGKAKEMEHRETLAIQRKENLDSVKKDPSGSLVHPISDRLSMSQTNGSEGSLSNPTPNLNLKNESLEVPRSLSNCNSWGSSLSESKPDAVLSRSPVKSFPNTQELSPDLEESGDKESCSSEASHCSKSMDENKMQDTLESTPPSFDLIFEKKPKSKREDPHQDVNLERLQEVNEDLGISGDNDDNNASVDEKHIELLKTFKRPLRPAALARNHQPGQRERPSVPKMGGGNAQLPQNSYMAKYHHDENPLFVPDRPLGFNSLIAKQAAKRAVNGQIPWKKDEEVFGSDSE